MLTFFKHGYIIAVEFKKFKLEERGYCMTELERVVAESGYKLKFIADYLGITYYALRMKLRGRSEFKASEIQKLSELLRLSTQDTSRLFLTQKV